MNIDKMTIKLRQAIGDADMLANEHGNAEITTEHLLLALINQKEGLLTPLFERLGVPPAMVSEKNWEIWSTSSPRHMVGMRSVPYQRNWETSSMQQTRLLLTSRINT